MPTLSSIFGDKNAFYTTSPIRCKREGVIFMVIEASDKEILMADPENISVLMDQPPE